LQSLPAEVQKNIERVRARCREYLKDHDDSMTVIPSGNDGLEQFTLSGALAIMVSDLKLCGGGCYKGITCDTGGRHMLAIYVRSGSTWNTAYEDQNGDIFLSFDASKYPPAFRAMVLGIPGDGKDCPKRQHDMLMRTYGPSTWKQSCDVIVKAKENDCPRSL
jgi:hypothetical protein